MSRHVLPVESGPDRRRYEVVAGWDAPLQYLFLDVFDVTRAGPWRSPRVVFSNLDLPEGPEMGIVDIHRVLARAGIAAPQGLAAALAQDRAENRSGPEITYPVQRTERAVDVRQLLRMRRRGVDA